MIHDVLQGKPLHHPLHPLLIHFPISLFVLSFLFDLGHLFGWGPPVLAAAAQYAIVLGIVMALLAAVAGFADYTGIRNDDPAKKIATWHMVLNLLVVALYGLSAALRYGAQYAVTPLGVAFASSTAGLVVLGISGYLGGKLVYEKGIAVGRHHRKKPAPKETIVASVEDDGYATAGPAADLEEGNTLRVDAGGTVMTVARVDGEIYAFQEYCTHRYGPLSEGHFHDGKVMCPWHRSCFDVKTGKATDGPAKVDLRTFEVQVSERGLIRVRPGDGSSGP